ncbi:BRCT domain-containing protein [Escherichia coli]|uniref:BRCT domain-containing protein n=1 Tax=Enterobacteriaceae TaxID=543 RepID=UPI000B17C614|nr:MULTISPECIES: BRCT domain-containing protein [Enterobacteriaceae]EHD3441781.1 BRCT domain-containing protein [Escherichia coli O152]EFK6636743.1 BRCT domain-containing protein [Escherichia coli]EFK6685149.1 BRCT domain-containing protein [Escherichia coli]EFK6714923.1 BRCT domain-containing protein [Escherichia coli]EFM1637055.1 BRCT domain-containing protein [Escherichia coli]
MPYLWFEVCFTGFKKTDKDRLKNSAISAGMIVRNDVTANLHILCCGRNAGPKKMEIAALKGTMILTESEFLDFLNLGVIPDKYCS